MCKSTLNSPLVRGLVEQYQEHEITLTDLIMTLSSEFEKTYHVAVDGLDGWDGLTISRNLQQNLLYYF